MNYREAIDYLYSLGNETKAMKLGLESVRALCRVLDDPQRKYPIVHIAGTNGKGSTSAMVEAIARAAGLKTGLYTSPHLIVINERIRVEGVNISDDDFASLATSVRMAGERLVRQGVLLAPPTYFEQVTAIGLLYFAECGVDLAILEVGLGGRLDATNVCEPLVAAITPVSFDHQEYLGYTLAEIAGEKAGIIKPRVPVIVAPQEPEAMAVIVEKAQQIGTELIAVDSPAHELISCEAIQSATRNTLSEGLFEFSYRTMRDEYLIELNLRGVHQVANARTAIHLAEELIEQGIPLSHLSVALGLRQVVWPGRLEMIEVGDKQRNIVLPMLLDGAHNPAGAKNLSDYLKQFCAERPITMILGMLADKPLEEMAQLLMPLADQIIATRISSPRTSDPQAIAALAERHGKPAISVDSAAQALEQAIGRTQANGLICICGSLYLIGEAKQILAAKKSTMSF